MMDIKWRFPGNNYTADNGLDTADMETFKKDAISSLAREVCQNSIDAKNPAVEGPVRIEFRSFSIDKDAIPGRADIEMQIDACIDTWSQNKKISEQLSGMAKQVRKDTITCLRISDFNTTGLVGVSGGDNTAWHYLVHGSGLSDKGATSGGSKGIGKYATFVTSYFNTVFYSTRAVSGEIGFEGICKLCSAKIENSTEKTQGIGYYGSSDMNEPILEEMSLDASFTRGADEFGSDIYILGFKDAKDWQKDIITKALDSFMAAIVFGTLELSIDGIEINKDTVKDIVFDDNFIGKKMRKHVISQYLLLADKEHRFEDTLTFDEYGDAAKLYLMEFKGEQEEYATNSCVMVRYPYMKIKELDHISTLPCSALCIIENNELNSVLRNVENPQHTNWEFNRIDDPAEKGEIQGLYKELVNQIRDVITKHLANSDETKTDLEGAGEYLPAGTDEGQTDKQPGKEVLDVPNICKKKVKAKTANINAFVDDPDGNGVNVDFINGAEGEEGEIPPDGQNSGSGSNVHPGDHESGGEPDDNGHEGMRPADLRGMNYRFFCKSKKDRSYGVTFVSDVDEENAYFRLYALDEAGIKTDVVLDNCAVNGEIVEVGENNTICLNIKKGQRYTISMITDQEELFSGEVKMYAYR